MPARNPVDSAVFDLVTAIIANPAAGDNLTYAVPANARIEIIYLGFILATDANAANRYPTILGATPTLNQTMAAAATAQVASKTYGWSFVAGLPAEVDLSAANIVVVPMSTRLILEPGDSLESYLVNIQAGDAITSIITRYKQWAIA